MARTTNIHRSSVYLDSGNGGGGFIYQSSRSVRVNRGGPRECDYFESHRGGVDVSGKSHGEEA